MQVFELIAKECRAKRLPLAIPVSIYLVSIWLVHVRRGTSSKLEGAAYFLTSALVLLAPMTSYPALVVSVLLVALTAESAKISRLGNPTRVKSMANCAFFTERRGEGW